MANSYRIKTQIGEDQTLNVQIDQEFDFLEILSMKIQSEDIYTRNCADYGVVVGRVVANGGYGVPNVKVSVFVPIQEEDRNMKNHIQHTFLRELFLREPMSLPIQQ
jgi:hypothetical protein